MIRYHVNKKEPLRAEHEAFLKSICNGSDVPVSGEDGLRALELAQALVTSGQEHRLIQMKNE